MSQPPTYSEQDSPPFEEDDREVLGLVIDIEGFEGPLDLLLTLARKQKLDLTQIEILPLVEQYLAFIHQAKSLKLDVAADYLVMAAWLAYLKSRLLLPPDPDDGEEELSGDELAALLAHRLKRLEAMRKASKMLLEQPQLGIDVFGRGLPEGLEIVACEGSPDYDTTLYQMLKAYAGLRQIQAVKVVTVKKRKVWSLKDARKKLEKMLQMNFEWTTIDSYLVAYLADPEERRTALAASFGASLEMVREGHAEIRQDGSYTPLYLRAVTPEKSLNRKGDA